MKNILFRGKTLTNGFYKKNEWVYGDFLHFESANIIMPSIVCYVDGVEHTFGVDFVGQYTGIDDNNGEKLFEGDIIKFISEDGVEVIAVVTYDENAMQFVFETKFSIYTLSDIPSLFDNGKEERFEIIGNFFDNPELINFECEVN